MTVDVGNMVGDYEVLASLGAGGVGRVYKVRHAITGRIEALKILLPDHAQDEEQAERFLREVKVQAHLAHPNIASVLNAFRVGNNLAMVMELVEGESLDKLIARGRLPLEQALDYASQAISALSYAHAQGVVHRDIKPENMLVTPQGRLKVTDFGLAKTAVDARLTATGATLGSLYYMSPEQVHGAPTLDERTDIYSMGVVLYELATGRRPFEGEQPFHLMLAHVEQQPTPPLEIDPSLPKSLNDAILKALQKQPVARFKSAGEFLGAVEAARKASAPGLTPEVASEARQAPGDEPSSPIFLGPHAGDDKARSRPRYPTAARLGEHLRGFAGKRRLPIAVFVAFVAFLAAFVVWRMSRPDPSKTVAVPSGSHQLLRKVIPAGRVQAVVTSLDGAVTASLSDSGVIEVWDSGSGQRLATFSGADKRSKALAAGPQGRQIAFIGNDSRLHLSDVGTHGEQLRFDTEGVVRSAAISSDSGLLAVASNRSLSIWEIDRGGRKDPLYRRELSPRVVAFRPNGSAVAAAAGSSVQVHSLQQSGVPSDLPMWDGGATVLAFDSEGNLLAAAGRQGLKLWRTSSLEEILSTKLPGGPLALGFTRSGHCVVLNATGQSAQIWDATNGVEVSGFLHDHDVTAGALSTDGRLAATATAAGDLWFWKADTTWDRPAATSEKSVFRRFVDVFRGGTKRNDSDRRRDGAREKQAEREREERKRREEAERERLKREQESERELQKKLEEAARESRE